MQEDITRANSLLILFRNYVAKITNQSRFDTFIFRASTEMFKDALKYKSLTPENRLNASDADIIGQYCPRVSIITNISIMDAFMSDLFRMLLLMFPNSLDNPSVFLNDILKCKSIDEILQNEIDKKVRSFSFESFPLRFQKIQKTFKLDFKDIGKELDVLNKAWKIRNRIVHECDYTRNNAESESMESIKEKIDEGHTYAGLVKDLLHVNRSMIKKVLLEIRKKIFKNQMFAEIDEVMNSISPA